jgi:hypothetical protein
MYLRNHFKTGHDGYKKKIEASLQIGSSKEKTIDEVSYPILVFSNYLF